MRFAIAAALLLLAAGCGQPQDARSSAPSVETVNPPALSSAGAPGKLSQVQPAAAKPAPAGSSVWIVDRAHSSIVVNGFMNKTQKPQSGVFDKWSAQIRFDPNDLEYAKVAVTIDTPSFKTGNPFYDGAVPDPDWLDEAAHPTATFVSTAISAQGPGKYIAKGTLTVKGVAHAVTLPFTLAIAGPTAEMQGELPLDLDTLGMGKQNDPDREYAAKTVTVHVAVRARRA